MQSLLKEVYPMRPNNRHERQKGLSKMLLIVILVLGLLLGLVGGVLGALFFAKSGPQGEQGAQGLQGLQGVQGLQGIQGLQGDQGVAGADGSQGVPGVNGTDAILQIRHNANSTAQATSSYTAMLWRNMSVFDPSMNMSVTVQQNSRVFVQFSATLSMEAPGSMWIRILVDNSFNSTLSIVSVGPPSAGTFRLSSHIEFLTGSLASGQHRIDVQFLRESGSPILLDRSLTFMELAT